MLTKLFIFYFILFAHTLVYAKQASLQDGLYAKIATNKGDILLALNYKKTPLTVINFVGLAEGSKKNTVLKANKPFYDGLKFHRVIKNFMIQGGDPLGNGRGGPGYQFPDEITELRHNKAGILSMANSGKNTNGSQFFITHRPTSHLDGKHSVFGEVVKGLDVVNKIKAGDQIKKIDIIRVGKSANNFATDEQAFQAALQRINAKEQLPFAAFIQKHYPNSKKTKSGVHYVILKAGQGKKVKKGDIIKAHYNVKLTNEKIINDSRSHNKPIEVQIGSGDLIPAWNEILPMMKIGERRIIITPYQQAYGQSGVPGIIPQKATLIFDVELLNIK